MRQVEEELIGAALGYGEARSAYREAVARLDAAKAAAHTEIPDNYMGRVGAIYAPTVERNRAADRMDHALVDLHRAIDRYRELG
jgi:hypothetical protein